MKRALKSLRLRMLLPVIAMTLFTVILLTTLFSRGFIAMILKQEKEVNAVGFETVSRTITPMIDTSITEVRNIMADDRITSYLRLEYASMKELIHARISCRDYLTAEITRHEAIYGLLFARENGSMFGVLPNGSFFWDNPEGNPLPDEIKTRIMNVPLGRTVWIGPISAAVFYGYENENNRTNVMIGVSKSVNVRYGECYALMLMDESVFADLFAILQDEKSSWHLFAEDRTEIYHTESGYACTDPERLINESNTGNILYDENGRALCAFSMTMTSPEWTLVREVSMDDYEHVVHSVRNTVWILAGLVFLAALTAYLLWMKRFMRQFNSLQNGIIRIGEGDLDTIEFESTSIAEFETMQQEINRTGAALRQQMDTIRRMEREQMEQENAKKEQERITRELSMAREIQANALPQVFPAFPDRTEFDLYASMTPAKVVGGDFYDFFFIDSDHLALVIADVSGKGIPAALFMMVSKTLIKNELMTGCDPAAALERVNVKLRERNSSMLFVTVWLAVVEISTGKGTACNAGHENPGIQHAGGKFTLLQYRHDMFVGCAKKAKYRNLDFELQPGDCIFVYTDGVPEALNGNDEMFGEKRLAEALNQKADAEPEELVHHVQDTVSRFVGSAPQFDDITILCFRYHGAGNPKDAAS